MMRMKKRVLEKFTMHRMIGSYRADGGGGMDVLLDVLDHVLSLPYIRRTH